jgi:hypothetical protein
VSGSELAERSTFPLAATKNALVHLKFPFTCQLWVVTSCQLAYCINVHESADLPHARLDCGGKGQTIVVEEVNGRLFRLNSERELASVSKGNLWLFADYSSRVFVYLSI